MFYPQAKVMENYFNDILILHDTYSVHFNRTADFNVYYFNFQYFDTLHFILPSNDPVTVVKQNEIGFTFGDQIKKKTKFIDIPRVGLAIRRGDGLDSYRLVFCMAF